MMAPFLAGLLKAGLGLVANAAIVHGSEWLEEKTGVKINMGAEPNTPELLQFKQFMLLHEEELQRIRLQDNRLELEYFQAEVADRGSARARDAEFVKAGTRNYRGDGMFLLAVAVICWLVFIVWKDASLNEYVKGIFTLVLGRFLGYLDNIYNFEFGTTRSSRVKDSSIENLTKGQTK